MPVAPQVLAPSSTLSSGLRDNYQVTSSGPVHFDHISSLLVGDMIEAGFARLSSNIPGEYMHPNYPGVMRDLMDEVVKSAD
jgi:hypothetical protein